MLMSAALAAVENRPGPQETAHNKHEEPPSGIVPIRRLTRRQQLREPATADELRDLDAARVEAALGHCADVPRPCPFVSCRHNNFLERFPKADGDPSEVDAGDSCSIDVAMQGPHTSEEVAYVLELSEEQVDAVVEGAGARLREAMAGNEEALEGVQGTPMGELSASTQGGLERGLEHDEEDRSGRVLPDRLEVDLLRVSYTPRRRGKALRAAAVEGGADHRREEYTRAIWKIYERVSWWRAFEAHGVKMKRGPKNPLRPAEPHPPQAASPPKRKT